MFIFFTFDILLARFRPNALHSYPLARHESQRHRTAHKKCSQDTDHGGRSQNLLEGRRRSSADRFFIHGFERLMRLSSAQPLQAFYFYVHPTLTGTRRRVHIILLEVFSTNQRHINPTNKAKKSQRQPLILHTLHNTLDQDTLIGRQM